MRIKLNGAEVEMTAKRVQVRPGSPIRRWHLYLSDPEMARLAAGMRH
jgi:hypothetical protein